MKPEKHGMYKSKEYNTWVNMRRRCNWPGHIQYPRYGGRGISVCDEWNNSFKCFISDMGNKPTPKHQIDRIDNDKNYEANNCRWVTHEENQQNKTSNKLNPDLVREIREEYSLGKSTHRGLAKKYGISHTHIRYIVNRITWRNI